MDKTLDYLVWDDMEPVTLYPSPRRPTVSYPVKRALRRAPTYRELAASAGAYTGQDLVWLIPVAESQGIEGQFPFRPGDVVQDKRLTPWTVLEVSLIVTETVWRCVTRNLVLAAGLRDEISILRPGVSKGAAAELVLDWTAAGGMVEIVKDLPARVQIVGAEPGVMNEIKSSQKRFVVILGQQVEMQANDRIVVTKGERKGLTLTWTASRNADRIDELPALDCMRV